MKFLVFSIYDKDKDEWYSVKRTWLGNLKLEKVICEGFRKNPGRDDIVYSDVNGLEIFELPPEPRTPQ